MATGSTVKVKTELSSGKTPTYEFKVWDGKSFIPRSAVQTIADLNNINYPQEGEAHIVYEDGCLYVYGKKNPNAANSQYHWENMGRVVAFSPAELWAQQPEYLGRDTREFLNWLKNGEDFVIYRDI